METTSGHPNRSRDTEVKQLLQLNLAISIDIRSEPVHGRSERADATSRCRPSARMQFPVASR
jgi:hypothetical protein